MRNFIIVLAGLVMACGFTSIATAQDSKDSSEKVPATSADVLADLYEHLATSIIEIRATEDSLVRGMLIEYHSDAQRLLAKAAEAGGGKKELEAAATRVSDIANEGDKRARAVRQRLTEAGHYHQKDTETAEDYMFINSKEKKSLFALAKRIGQLGSNGDAAEIKKASAELKSLFEKAITPD